MNEKYARNLLGSCQVNYNKIASHFSNTRSYVWKDLEYFKRFIRNNDKILDLGCGNGRLFELFKDKDVEYIGIDNSKELIKIAKQKYPNANFQVGSALNLPFQDNSFNKIFSIAVFHHIPSKKLRLQFLQEVKRVLKPNGLLILTVWNLWNRKCLRLNLKHIGLKMIGKSKLDFKDIFYPWKNQQGEVLAQRYIHCFTKKELKKLLRKTGFQIKEIGFLGKQKRNIYLIARIDKMSNVRLTA